MHLQLCVSALFANGNTDTKYWRVSCKVSVKCLVSRYVYNNTVSVLARDAQAKLAFIVAQIYPSVHLCVCPRQLESMESSL